MPKKGPPDSEESAPVAAQSFNAPKASESTLAALLQALQQPQAAPSAPRPIHPVQGIAGAILGAIDPEAYERLVKPALAERKTDARRDYETQREQRGENIEALSAAHDLTRQSEQDAINEQARQIDAEERARERQDRETLSEELGRILESKVRALPSQLEHANEMAQELMQADAKTPEGSALRDYGRMLSYAIVGQTALVQDIENRLATAQPGDISPDTFERWNEAFSDIPKMIGEAAAKKAMFAHARLQASLRPADGAKDKKYVVPTAVQNKIDFYSGVLSSLYMAKMMQEDPSFAKSGGPAAAILGPWGPGGDKRLLLEEIYSQMNTLWIPERLGANIPVSDQRLVSGLKPTIEDKWDKQVSNVNELIRHFESYSGGMRKRLRIIYGRPPDEIDDLMSGYGKAAESGSRLPTLGSRDTFVFPPDDAMELMQDDEKYLATGDFAP